MSEPVKAYGINLLRETWVVRESTHRSMQANKSAGTKPEETLAKALFATGLRGYRRNDKRFPGKPDIYVPRAKIAVFVHGCFWHGCTLCGTYRQPQTNSRFWAEKLARNQARDALNCEKLRSLGITPIIIWECQVKNELDSIVKDLMLRFSREAS